MIGLASPRMREQQNPTGTVGAPARAMLLFLYSGIALGGAGTGKPWVYYAQQAQLMAGG